jgi:hypothetical protein
MKLALIGGLPFVAATATFRGQSIDLEHVLVDTGSAGTVFAADHLLEIDVLPEPDDPLRRIAGVGGSEVLDSLAVGGTQGSCQIQSEFEVLRYVEVLRTTGK